MSTRAMIAVVQPDGTVNSAYCVTNGWPNAPFGVGYLLTQHWHTPELANRLISHGDMVALGKHIGVPGAPRIIDLDSLTGAGDQNIYLGRDYNRPGHEMKSWDSLEQLARHQTQAYDFAYVFTRQPDDQQPDFQQPGTWHYTHCAHQRAIPGTLFPIDDWVLQEYTAADEQACCICNADNPTAEGVYMRAFDAHRRICEDCFAKRYPQQK